MSEVQRERLQELLAQLKAAIGSASLPDHGSLGHAVKTLEHLYKRSVGLVEQVNPDRGEAEKLLKLASVCKSVVPTAYPIVQEIVSLVQ